MTRFHVGESFTLPSGIPCRIVPGDKVQWGTGERGHDAVIQWHTPSGWRNIKNEDLWLLCDFICWNEDNIYPPEYGYQGGTMFRSTINTAMKHGHLVAQTQHVAAKAQRTLFDFGNDKEPVS